MCFGCRSTVMSINAAKSRRSNDADGVFFVRSPMQGHKKSSQNPTAERIVYAGSPGGALK
jgi:hypothetical protein